EFGIRVLKKQFTNNTYQKKKICFCFVQHGCTPAEPADRHHTTTVPTLFFRSAGGFFRTKQVIFVWKKSTVLQLSVEIFYALPICRSEHSWRHASIFGDNETTDIPLLVDGSLSRSDTYFTNNSSTADISNIN